MDITVAIPVYNAGEYIYDTLSSVLDQDFKGTYEIIVVDDHGTDNSIDIVEKLKEEHNRGSIIRILRPDKNIGQAAGRRLALDNAQGEYFYMLDADDVIALYTLSYMYNLQKEYNVDFVYGSYAIGVKEDERCVLPEALCTNNQEIQLHYYSANFGTSIWNMLYRTDFIKEFDFVFEGRKLIMSEDTFLLCQILHKAQRVYFTSKITYYYRLRWGSAAYEFNIGQEYKSILEDELRLNEEILRFATKNESGNDAYKGYRLKRVVWNRISIAARVNYMYQEKRISKKEYKSYLKQIITFPIEGSFVNVIKEILQLNFYSKKLIMLYFFFSLFFYLPYSLINYLLAKHYKKVNAPKNRCIAENFTTVMQNFYEKE